MRQSWKHVTRMSVVHCEVRSIRAGERNEAERDQTPRQTVEDPAGK
jgi:hypothetical protein